jgi:NADH pyrophosphatase NudC (nudix superfamily)
MACIAKGAPAKPYPTIHPAVIIAAENTKAFSTSLLAEQKNRNADLFLGRCPHVAPIT